jgi:hypothetical protein
MAVFLVTRSVSEAIFHAIFPRSGVGLPKKRNFKERERGEINTDFSSLTLRVTSKATYRRDQKSLFAPVQSVTLA